MNCIICLDECKNNYLQFPNNITECKCKYNVHKSCLEYYNNHTNIITYKCFLCRGSLIVYNKNIYHNLINYYKIEFIMFFFTFAWAIILLSIPLCFLFIIIGMLY